MKPCFFIFGFGYTAKFLAPKLVQLGFNVVGTTRKHINNDELSNIEFIDLNHFKIEEYLRKATHILISIPPDKEINAGLSKSNVCKEQIDKTHANSIISTCIVIFIKLIRNELPIQSWLYSAITFLKCSESFILLMSVFKAFI